MQRWFSFLSMVLLTVFVAACSKISNEPSPEFMDSMMIVRAGIDDLGNVTVKEFISVLKRVQKPDGSTADLLGWQKTDSGYTLRTKIAGEFDLNFQWSKAEKIVLLEEMSMDNGDSITGMQFFMMMASMPKVKAESPADGSKPVAGSPSSASTTIAASANANTTTTTPAGKANAERRTLMASKLQSIECNDYCQLQYLDTAGVSQTALCVDAEQCKAWAKEPKSFAAFVGVQAELAVEAKFIPEGNATIDNIVAIKVAQSNATVAAAATSAPSVTAAGNAGSPLCKQGEATAFACSTGKKDVALCASGNAQGGGMQLTYRIAPTGQTSPEMIYPEQTAAAKTAFKSGSQSFTGDKSVSYASFDRGEFRYVIYSAEGKGFDKAGVAVEQSGKRIANLACSTAVAGDWSPIAGAGLPSDTRGFVMP